MKNRSKPRKTMLGEQIRELARRQLTPKRIAGILSQDADLIRTCYKREYRQGKLVGLARMRELLFKQAVYGDVNAQIFLGERLVFETREYKDSEIKELFPEIWEQVAMTPIKRRHNTSTKNGGDK